jgi:adenylyltransferase/sulfurtransferase
VLLGKTNVYASIFRFEGQASVFNQLLEDETRGPNFRDLFPVPPPPGLVPSCAEGGVLGVLPGILGSIQANEVIKVITGLGDTLSGRLFLFDAATFEVRIVKVRKDPDNPISGHAPTQHELIDYVQFCGIGTANSSLKSLSVQDLYNWTSLGEDFQLIDVREPYEYEIANIEGLLIPKGDVEQNLELISRTKKVVVHCRSGKRSADVIELLEQKYGFDNLYNLEGGILAWAKEIEPALSTI